MTRVRDIAIAFLIGGLLGWAVVEFITPDEVEVVCDRCV
jgi:hypothetical protein